MKVLVTGGMGFIGKEVTKKLIAIRQIETITIVDILSEQIHGAGAVPYDFGSDKVAFIKGDVSDEALMKPLLLNHNAIIHLAAETGTGQSMYDIAKYTRTNVNGTALMLDILSNNKHQIKRLVVASSRAVYGEGRYNCSEHGEVFPCSRLSTDMERGDFEVKCPVCKRNVDVLPTTENSRVAPHSYYGITKYFQENSIMVMCPNIGIEPVALRYQNVYGAGQSLKNPYTGILSIFSNLFRANKNVNIFEDGVESRDFVHVSDVAEATCLALLEDDVGGSIINVGTGGATSVLEVANLLKKYYDSSSLINISGDFRIGDIRHNYSDNAKLKLTLKFEPKVMFADGLKDFVQWVMSQDIGPDLYQKSLQEMKEKGLYKEK